MSSYSLRKARAQQRAAARKASEARGYWAPYASQNEAITGVVSALRGKGHGILTQGACLECFRCGLSGCVYGSEEQGAHVIGGLSSLEECKR